MNVLIVAPVEGGSGETVTARHLGRMLKRRGHRVHFLASPFAARFLQDEFPDGLTSLTYHGPDNFALWSRLLRNGGIDVVVFADYPLLFLRSGVVPLGREPRWESHLEELDVPLVTLDHFGFAQTEMGLFMGPPHLCHEYHRFNRIPSNMHILLPCPMHEPYAVTGRKGIAFRYWDLPLEVSEPVRATTRKAYLDSDDQLVVFHIVSTWAWQSAESLGLSFYRHLAELLQGYLSALGSRVKIISLNNGRLLEPKSNGGVRVVNIGQIAPPAFANLLLSADLLLTENKVSISMGKAICGLRPAAVLKNSHGVLDLLDRCTGHVRDLVCAMERDRPGSVFPYESYPTDLGSLLDEVILYKGNTLKEGFAELEVFGGEATSDRLIALLASEEARAGMRQRQQCYVERLSAIDDGATALERVVAH